MQQNVVVVPVKLRQGDFRADGTVVGTKKQGRFTWTVKVYRGRAPVADKRQVLHSSGVKV